MDADKILKTKRGTFQLSRRRLLDNCSPICWCFCGLRFLNSHVLCKSTYTSSPFQSCGANGSNVQSFPRPLLVLDKYQQDPGYRNSNIGLHKHFTHCMELLERKKGKDCERKTSKDELKF